MLKLLLRYLLKRSVSQTGILAPIIISRSGIVLDGNHRVKLARELGLLVPVVRIDSDIEYIDPDDLQTYFDQPADAIQP